MAVYDPAHRRMCVRVVYDGPAGAGKTTNVRQLAGAFATQTWGEVDTPEEMAGRTLWFDWLQIRAGVVCGFPLICQVITVPGQVALTPRRRRLLDSADVVVFVCESSVEGLARSREALALVDDLRRDRPGALRWLVQANKQDHPDALPPAQLASLLGEHEAQVVGAIASEGVGVVDTFVAAVRSLSRALEERVSTDGLRVRAAPLESARSMLRRLEATVIAPEDAAEMVLEEAASLLVAGPAAPPEPASRAVEVARRAPLPAANAPTGFVWPAHTGRATLQLLGAEGALDGSVTLDAMGEVDIVIAGHELRTALRRRFDGVESARQALVHAARERTQLEALLVTGTVLCLQEDREGGAWLWRVTPRLPRWQDCWRKASDTPERDRLLHLLAVACVDGALLALRRGLSVTATLESFVLQGDGVRYRGELAPCEQGDEAAARLLAALAEQLETVAAPSGRFVDAVHLELGRRTTTDATAVVARALGANAA
jgi:signal recognition particle receptor subunit beta